MACTDHVGEDSMRNAFIVARQILRRGSISALLGATCLATLVAASFELPPINVPASQERHPGKVIWVDLVTRDLEGAKHCYGGLFGWTFRDISTGQKDKNYTLALLDGQPVGGLFHRAVPAGQQRQPAWMTFISVRDVAAAERVVLARGGKVLSKPHSYCAPAPQPILADPQAPRFP